MTYHLWNFDCLFLILCFTVQVFICFLILDDEGINVEVPWKEQWYLHKMIPGWNGAVFNSSEFVVYVYHLTNISCS